MAVMEEKNFDKAAFLYQKRVCEEKETKNPDDVELAIQNMLAEIRAAGYGEYAHLADIRLRSIKSRKIMEILVKYYAEMDRYTRDMLMYKINPKWFPEILPIAKQEFLVLGASEWRVLRGFAYVLSKAEFTEEYCGEMLALLGKDELYIGLADVRKVLAKKYPEKLLPLMQRYSACLLALDVIRDCTYLADTAEAGKILAHFCNIQTEEAETLRKRENNRLGVTNYEYYLNICTAERLRADAERALKMIDKK